MSGLRIKPVGQEVPVEVLADGVWVSGELWAWQRTWTGGWAAWVRGDGVPERLWEPDAIRATAPGGDPVR
ncbi:hypothetical protein [Knoellia sp. LjRoot47]|uniref:hypothetical protein n=1 Tax=Knoellia sp. LjRoot47 TaxID=3342330 RepID=UPI003ECE554C